MTKPDVTMYAILKNNIVIDFGWADSNKAYSILTSKDAYELNNEIQLIEMTIENSPAEINMKYNGQKFFY